MLKKQLKIDFNCDMGEGMAGEAIIMPFISSANISCGLHAGDGNVIRNTIALALSHNVSIGAHPSFDDRAHFGRTEMKLGRDELYRLIIRQLESFQTIAASLGADVHHVKPHGALYNLSARDETTARCIAEAVKDFNPGCILMGLSGSASVRAAKIAGLTAWNEVFADRTYTGRGTLTPRHHPGALIDSLEALTTQVKQMIHKGTVTATDGTVIPVEADTICIHGDGAQAPVFAKAIFEIVQSCKI